MTGFAGRYKYLCDVLSGIFVNNIFIAAICQYIQGWG